MQIDEIVLNYRKFLIAGWSYISEILINLNWDESPYFLDEWMQANWELLVEKQIDNELVLASYGFDNSARCRYSDKNKIVTHQIICWDKERISESKYIFLCFTTKVNQRFEIAPPFDYVNVEDFLTKERLVLPLGKLNFSLDQIIKIP